MLINGSSSRLALLAIAALALVGCSKKENYGADTTGAASSTAMADTSRMAASTTPLHAAQHGASSANIRNAADRGYRPAHRLKPIPKRDMQGKVWASPAIMNILKESGKEYANVIEIEEEDEYYDSL